MAAKQNKSMAFTPLFLNYCFDKGRLKSLITWSLVSTGEKTTIEVVERLKDLGFRFATEAGTSLGVDDLKVPPEKLSLVSQAKQQVQASRQEYERGNLTALERLQQLVDTWHRTSETLKQTVVNHFQSTDKLSPVYMMAFSGARGNISQVRQLAGMRGLMADPQGQIIGFPIRSNFREGLTLIEYMISCYGARKGLVDTALRTADAGYLTRRLVDVSQHMVIRTTTCATPRGIPLRDIQASGKIVFPLRDRLMGRVLAEDVTASAQPPQQPSSRFSSVKAMRRAHWSPGIAPGKAREPGLLAARNQEISDELAATIARHRDVAHVRSSLTCSIRDGVCQLCYGWSLSDGRLVTLGEAVGIIAAQSIGEPGTQLTMRTFHTGGVFSGEVMAEVRAPHEGTINFHAPLPGLLVRTSHGKVAFLTKGRGSLSIKGHQPSSEALGPGRSTGEPTTPTGKLFDSTSGKDYGAKPKGQQQDGPSKRVVKAGWGVALPPSSTNKPSMAPLDTTISIEAATLLFVRQGERVARAQLLGELSSMGVDQNETVEATRTLFAELSGKIALVQLLFGSPVRENQAMSQMSKSLGRIWVLSGQKSPIATLVAPYGQGSHLVDRGSLMARMRDGLDGARTVEATLRSSPSHWPLASNRTILDKYAAVGDTKLPPFKMEREGLLNGPLAGGEPLAKWPVQGIEKQGGLHPAPARDSAPSNPGMWLLRRQDHRITPTSPTRQGAVLYANSLCFAPNGGYRLQLSTLSTLSTKEAGQGLLSCAQPQGVGDLPLGTTMGGHLKRGRASAILTHQGTGAASLPQSSMALCADGPHLSVFLNSWRIGPTGIVWIDSRCVDRHLARGEAIWVEKQWTSSGQARADGLSHLVADLTRQQASGAMVLIAQDPPVGGQGPTNPRARTPGGAVGHGPRPKQSNGGFAVHLGPSPQGQRGGPLSIASLEGLGSSALLRRERGALPGGAGAWKQPQTALHWSGAGVDPHLSQSFGEWRWAVPIAVPRLEAAPLSPDTGPSLKALKRVTVEELQTKWTPTGAWEPLATMTAAQTPCSAEWLYCPMDQTSLSYCHESLQFCGEAGLDGLVFGPSPTYFEAVIGGQHRYGPLDTKPLIEIKLRLLADKGEASGRADPTGDVSRSIGLMSWFRPLIAQPLSCHSLGQSLPSSSARVGETSRTGLLLLIRKAFLLPSCLTSLTHVNWDGPMRTSTHGPNNESQVANGESNGQVANGESNGRLGASTTARWLDYQFFLWKDLVNDDGFLWLRRLSIQGQWISNRGSRFGPPGPPLGRGEEERGGESGQSAVPGGWLHLADLVARSPSKGRQGLFHGQGRPRSRPLPYTARWAKPTSWPLRGRLSAPTQSLATQAELDGPSKEPLLPYLFEFETCSVSRSTELRGVDNWEADQMQPAALPTTPAWQCHPLVGTGLQIGRVAHSWPIKAAQGACKPSNPVPVTLGAANLRKRFTRPWLTECSLFAALTRGSRCPLPSGIERAGRSQPLQAIKTATQWQAFGEPLAPRPPGPLGWPISLAKIDGSASGVRGQLAPPGGAVGRGRGPKGGNGRGGDQRGYSPLVRVFQAILPVPGVVHHSLPVPSIRQAGTKLVPKLPSPRWRLAPLATIDGFQTAILSRPLHLVRFVAHLLPEELVDVAIQLTESGPSSALLLFAAGRSGNDEKQSEAVHLGHGRWPTARPRQLAIGSDPLPIQPTSLQSLVTPVNSWVTGEMIAASRRLPNSPASRSAPSPLLARNDERLFLTEPDCVGLAIEGRPDCQGLGQFLGLGEEVAPGQATALPGQVIAIERGGITLRRTQVVLFYSQGGIHVRNGEWIKRGAPILTLTYQKLVTGDIVQGIPKIEQFFEAPTTREGEPIPNSLQTQVRRSFERLQKIGPAPQAVKGSIEDVQQALVEGILKVYLSQGVRIADKHLEIVVRQMTSKGHVLDAGDTGLFRGEQVDLGRIERLNLATYGKRAHYEPAVLGITKAALDSDSFISAASFQETTRVLSRDTLIGKTDFLRGLKERVVLGDLIQAGTGIDDNINYGLLFGLGPDDKWTTAKHP